jgi:hypothetical protein
MNAEQETQAMLVAALRILELPAPLGETPEDEAILQAAESILSPVSRHENTIAVLRSALKCARASQATAEAMVELEKVALAVAKLKGELNKDLEWFKYQIWLKLPAAVRAQAMVARRAANEALHELACQEEAASNAEAGRFANFAWNNGEAVLSEAILWDIPGAEAFGIELEPLPPDDEL